LFDFSWISESQTYKNLDQSLSGQVSNIHPYVLLVLLYIILFSVVCWIGIRLWKTFKGPDSDLILQYKQKFEQSNADSQQKSIILTLIDQVTKEVPTLLNKLETCDDESEVLNFGRRLTDMIITQIPLLLKSMKNISHRCAVFKLDPEDVTKLMIFEGCGFSIMGKENLRLDINDSIAGNVYKNGEYIYCKDITAHKNFSPHPKATKQYYSLLCVPIVYKGNTIGVLSIDGSTKDCFTQDDIEYFKMFSNQLAIIFHVLEILDEKGGILNGREKVEDVG
jgi:transcriptional regulator with GAF, ATPase, and Fis domain